MILFGLTAFLVGFVHSLSPGHWLPVVFLVRSKRWGGQHAFFAALVAALGHVTSSVLLGALVFIAGDSVFGKSWNEIEGYTGLILMAFGVLYALLSFRKHSHCHGHEHHGPSYRKGMNPFLFLFSIGLAPCFAVLPVFLAASTSGVGVLASSMGLFSLGVFTAFFLGSYLSVRGHFKLDHPLFEHYGDVLTGVAVFVSGALLLVFPEIFHYHPKGFHTESPTHTREQQHSHSDE